MTISVAYNDVEFIAKVIYNFKQISDVILLQCNKPICEGENSLLIEFDHEKKEWKNTDQLEKYYPGLFDIILNRLSSVIKEHKRTYASDL